MNYYYQDAHGARQGPSTAEALAELARERRVHSGTLVWCEGMANWQAISTVAELAGIQAVSGPPAMPPPAAKGGGSGGDAGVSSLIPYKNVQALIGYYLGVFGLISILLGPLALFGIVPLVLGIIGLRNARANPGAKGTAHAWVAIVLGGLETLVGIVFVVIIAIAMAGR